MEQPLAQLENSARAGDAQAMYQLGLYALRHGEVKTAFDWLHKAGEKKHTRAIELLGVLILQGHGVKADPALAFEYFRSAAMTGDAQALMRCAELMFSGKGVNKDQAGALSCVVESAKQGYPIALRTLGFILLRQGDSCRDAAKTAFKIAAYGGDPHSQYYMARNASSVAEQNAWMAHAAQSGLYLAKQHFKSESAQANLVDLKGDLRACLDALVPVLDSFTDLAAVSDSKVLLSDIADIYVMDELLSVAEAEYLINAAAPMLHPAKVVHANDTVENEQVRTGMTASLGKVLDVVVDWLVLRISAVTGQCPLRAEVPSVICYRPGQMYKQHGDYLPAGSELAAEGYGGQRTHTALVYLNDNFIGGSTTFNLLGLNVTPQQGKLLTFTNVTDKAEPLELSQHTGEAVESGEKWLLSIWYRQMPAKTH
ncbi:2OG-Fe(II) oxygenase [Rheinheimera nanhaiensis]|uniref:Prolyl 4-hydroxylase n=1 Tax=Rheinheimera nanhaiensis E407-8 TaxID=562729 RepID=I1DZ88_9GAMM|nr:2OG-Fe(II) oxygenase [Rheinheimera nanhaiensis]MDX5406442.1 2OG-Fe(II) oxygenase [Chromatiaceae bacterium]GAB59366.1 prolyl 4-hydroxylase [Rheinheimera nanhaiensis E407-8]